MGRADYSVAHERAGGNAWHNKLPAWIKADPTYHCLRQGPRHTLQVMADRCDAPPRDETGEIIGSAPLLVCFGGRRLRDACGCGSRTVWRHLGKLIELGYVVPLSHGVGRLANIYGVPGRRGDLDLYSAEQGERRGTGPGGRWEREDTTKLLGLLCQNDTLAGGDPTKTEAGQNDTAAVPKRHSSRARMTRQPRQNDTLPSPLPSSSTSAHDPSPLRRKKARALLDNDAGGRPPEPNTDPLVDQLSISLPDGAGPDQVKAILRRYGVHRGRAYNLASNRHVTPAMIRDVLGKAIPHLSTIANSGAYIGSLMEDAIAEAKVAEREREARATEAERQRVAEAAAALDGMSDEDLQAWIDSIGALKGLSPAEVRADPVFRVEVARRMSSTREVDVAPVAGVPT